MRRSNGPVYSLLSLASEGELVTLDYGTPKGGLAYNAPFASSPHVYLCSATLVARNMRTKFGKRKSTSMLRARPYVEVNFGVLDPRLNATVVNICPLSSPFFVADAMWYGLDFISAVRR